MNNLYRWFYRKLSDKKNSIIRNKKYIKDMQKFIAFLSSINMDNIKLDAKNSKKIAIYVAPWHYTCVAWYAITLALMYKRLGNEVVIIWDDIIIYDEGNTQYECKYIKKLLFENVYKFVKIISLSSVQKASIDNKDKEEIKRLAHLKTIHHLKTSFPMMTQKEVYEKYENLLLEAIPYVKAIFKQDKQDFYVVPGGVCGNSGLFYWAGKINDIRVASYDSGEGLLIIGTASSAPQLKDIDKILNSNLKFVKNNQKALQLARNELKLRFNGEDRWNIQKCGYENQHFKANFDIVIPLNIEWDTAALGIHKVFNTTCEWVTQTIEFILNNTNSNVAVRQHPHEKNFESYIFAQKYLSERFKENKRFQFISCHDTVNTYSLIKEAKVVLPLSSTLGIEAAMMGKCVIVSSDCYYSKLPFVISSETKEEYFNRIKKAIELEDGFCNKNIADAELAYYFSQCCNWTQTDFTPIPKDFDKWVNIGFDNLLNDSSVQNVLTAFSENIPIAVLHSDKIMNSGM